MGVDEEEGSERDGVNGARPFYRDDELLSANSVHPEDDPLERGAPRCPFAGSSGI